MKKQTIIIAALIFSFLNTIASVEADEIVWSSYDKALGLPISQNLNKINDLLGKDINKTLEEYNTLITAHQHEVITLTDNEWNQDNQNKITELMLAINILEESKTNIAYDFVMHQLTPTVSLIEIGSKIGDLNNQIKGHKHYLINNQFLSPKSKKEIKEQIFDLKNRKNALKRIAAEKTTENIITNSSLFNKKTGLGALFLLACSSSPLFALKLFLTLLFNGGLSGMYLMTAKSEGARKAGAGLAAFGLFAARVSWNWKN